MNKIKNAEQYILFCLVSLLLLTGLNSFFFIMKEALGYGPGTFFFTSQDRFADLVKTALSYRDVLLKVPTLRNSIENLSQQYQFYFYNNPYGGIKEIEGLTHFHMTPISTLLNILCGLAIAHGKSPDMIMFMLFSGCILLAFASTQLIVKNYKKSLFLVALIVLSYPLLMTVTRGNYSAFFCGIGVIAFLNSLFINKKIDYFSILLFAIAINFRPNAVILMLALPLMMGLRKSFLPAMKITIAALAIFIFTYLYVNSIYPDYTLSSFSKGLSSYYKIYVIGSNGDAFSSSLYSALKMFSKNLDVITWIFKLFSVFFLLAAGRLIFQKNTNPEYYPFILSSLYILLTQVVGDYHLFVFIVPVFIIYNNFEYWQNDQKGLMVITISTLLLLAPKNYFFIDGVSLQVAINPAIMLGASVFLYYKIETKPPVYIRKTKVKKP